MQSSLVVPGLPSQHPCLLGTLGRGACGGAFSPREHCPHPSSRGNSCPGAASDKVASDRWGTSTGQMAPGDRRASRNGNCSSSQPLQARQKHHTSVHCTHTEHRHRNSRQGAREAHSEVALTLKLPAWKWQLTLESLQHSSERRTGPASLGPPGLRRLQDRQDARRVASGRRDQSSVTAADPQKQDEMPVTTFGCLPPTSAFYLSQHASLIINAAKLQCCQTRSLHP